MQARNENILTSTDKINTSEEIDKLIKTCTCRERRIFPIVIERNYPLIFVSLWYPVDNSQLIFSVDIYWPVRLGSKPICGIWGQFTLAEEKGQFSLVEDNVASNRTLKALRAKPGCILDVRWTGVPSNCLEGYATFDLVFIFLLVRIWIFSHDSNQAQEVRTTAVCPRRTSGVSVYNTTQNSSDLQKSSRTSFARIVRATAV